jgi:hypothetical protein
MERCCKKPERKGKKGKKFSLHFLKFSNSLSVHFLDYFFPKLCPPQAPATARGQSATTEEMITHQSTQAIV